MRIPKPWWSAIELVGGSHSLRMRTRKAAVVVLNASVAQAEGVLSAGHLPAWAVKSPIESPQSAFSSHMIDGESAGWEQFVQ